MGADDAPPVGGNMRIGDRSIDNVLLLTLAERFIEIGRVNLKISIPAKHRAKFAEQAGTRVALDVKGERCVGTFRHSPEERLEEAEAFLGRVTKSRKEETGLPFGS